MSRTAIIVGVISDTHGLLRPEATEALKGSDLIVHAGDVGGAQILEQLRAIAPTFAVRGNVDTGEWAKALPMTDVVEVGQLQLYVLHDVAALDLDPKPPASRQSFTAIRIAQTQRFVMACCF